MIGQNHVPGIEGHEIKILRPAGSLPGLGISEIHVLHRDIKFKINPIQLFGNYNFLLPGQGLTGFRSAGQFGLHQDRVRRRVQRRLSGRIG